MERKALTMIREFLVSWLTDAEADGHRVRKKLLDSLYYYRSLSRELCCSYLLEGGRALNLRSSSQTQLYTSKSF